MPDDSTILVLFDGDCGFCSRSIRFLADHDPADRFRFAPLQSAAGRSRRVAVGLPEDLQSVVVIESGIAYTRSSALLRLAPHLPRPYRWLSLGRLVPRPIRDAVYGLIATHRRRLAGRALACEPPSDALRARLIDR